MSQNPHKVNDPQQIFSRFSENIKKACFRRLRLKCSAESDVFRRKYGERLAFPDESIFFKINSDCF